MTEKTMPSKRTNWTDQANLNQQGQGKDRSRASLGLSSPSSVARKAVDTSDLELPLAEARQPAITTAQFRWMQTKLELNSCEFASLIGMPVSVFKNCRKGNHSINDPLLTERLNQLLLVIQTGDRLFKQPGGFSRWLRSPQWDLENELPLSLLNTRSGLSQIEEILNRIEYGLPL